MKIYKILVFILVSILFFSCQNDSSHFDSKENKTIKTIKLHNNQDSIDYALGVVIGNQMRNYGITDVNYSVLIKAVNDVISDDNKLLPINSDEAKKIISLYVQKTKNRKIIKYLDKNSSFLVENAKKSDIKTLANGMQYKILKNGKGKYPKLSDRVVVEYSGQLVDGHVFVSTKSAKPVTFVVQNSLLGWQSSLTKMQEGSQWIIYLPPNLAYGSKGNSKVPPNSIVIYKIKLIKIL